MGANAAFHCLFIGEEHYRLVEYL